MTWYIPEAQAKPSIWDRLYFPHKETRFPFLILHSPHCHLHPTPALAVQSDASRSRQSEVHEGEKVLCHRGWADGPHPLSLFLYYFFLNSESLKHGLRAIASLCRPGAQNGWVSPHLKPSAWRFPSLGSAGLPHHPEPRTTAETGPSILFHYPECAFKGTLSSLLGCFLWLRSLLDKCSRGRDIKDRLMLATLEITSQLFHKKGPRVPEKAILCWLQNTKMWRCFSGVAQNKEGIRITIKFLNYGSRPQGCGFVKYSSVGAWVIKMSDSQGENFVLVSHGWAQNLRRLL